MARSLTLSTGYNSGYTLETVKTAISIPNELFERGERVALRLGITRSELYQRALALFLNDHEGATLTEELDALYQQEPHRSELDPVIQTLQGASLTCDRSEEDEW